MKIYLSTLLLLWMHCSYADTGLQLGKLHSGVYENLMLAVDEVASNVTGFYESDGGGLGDKVGGPPHWTCSFYFVGKMIDSPPWKIVATTFWPDSGKSDVVNGVIAPATFASQPALVLKLEKPLPGCSRGEDVATAKPTSRSLEKSTVWIEIRMVAAKKAWFYADETSLQPRKTYVTAGDIVTVYKRSADRVQAEFIAKKKTKGWLLERDLFPLDK